MKKKMIIATIILGCLACSQIANALTNKSDGGVAISGSRIIYNEESKEVDFLIKNKGSKLKFIQTWIDDGSATATASESSPNFFINPPLFRLKPHTGKTPRIFFVDTKKALPKDRETLFWFNIVAIPSSTPEENQKNKNKNKNGRIIKVAQRTRLKLFYRPAALKNGSSDAVAKLKWSFSSAKKTITVENPTGFYVSTLRFMLVDGSGNSIIAMKKPTIIKPFASLSYPVTKIKNFSPPYKNVELKWIDDSGSLGSTSYVLDAH